MNYIYPTILCFALVIIGLNNASSQELMEVEGGVKVGNTALTLDGTIKYTGSDLEGRVGGVWKSLTSGSSGGNGSSLWSINGSNLFYNGGNVGIGTNTPGAMLDVSGHIWQTGIGGSVFIGQGAGANDDFSNNKNVFIGTNAGYNTTTGPFNIAIGDGALFSNTTGNANIAIGAGTLSSNSTGFGSIAIGRIALRDNTTGHTNIAIGDESLLSNTTGTQNTAIGPGALKNNTNGSFNTASGWLSLVNNTTGKSNTAISLNALRNNSTGDNNTAIGASALIDNTTGTNSVASGFEALSNNTTGNSNTAIGYRALNINSTGNLNTAIGHTAYFTNNNLSNTSCIGYLSGRQSNASNRIEIGNTSVSWIGGQVAWGTYSDRRIKENIKEDVKGLAFINALRPVTYNLDIHAQNDLTLSEEDSEEMQDWDGKYDIEQVRMTGFIAQEVETAAENAGYDFSGVHQGEDEVGLYSLRYAEFVVPLVKAVKELNSELAIIKADNESTRKNNIELKSENSLLKKELQQIKEYIGMK